jgi:hypothetical protein
VVASAFLRKIGVLDKNDINSYKRFAAMPKSDCAYVLYRGDTRDPEMIKTRGGFFPQPGRHGVSDSGGSTAMVCLSTDASAAATYYAYVKQYYGSPTWGKEKPRGFVYAVFLPTGRGILNYKMAEKVGSKNVGSSEISTLVVPWDQIVGWRQMPYHEDCKPGAKDWHFVKFHKAFEVNPDFNGNLKLCSRESIEGLQYFMGFDDIIVHNSKKL